MERAHVVPRSRGGSDTCENLVLLCKPCHTDSPVLRLHARSSNSA
ncbi:HNH endonuclease [Nonomuraea sp. SYSU D8015]